jgi:hypothetical protein
MLEHYSTNKQAIINIFKINISILMFPVLYIFNIFIPAISTAATLAALIRSWTGPASWRG